MSSYNDLLHIYKKDFEQKDIPISTIKAFLFELCTEKDIDLYTNLDNDADKEIEDKFHKGIAKILDGMPMNYVLGYCWFYGYQFIVNEDVLIPRYETEELVLQVLKKIDVLDRKDIVLADVGTGSGAIAISLKKEAPELKVYASDISKEALEVAKKNAEKLDAEVEFMAGDMLKPLIERNIKLDFLVSNPPYIPSEETMEHSVVDYEPHVALFGGKDGLKFYQSIINDAPKILNKGAYMAFEIGYNQKEALSDLFAQAFDADIDVIKDINGKDRILMVKLH